MRIAIIDDLATDRAPLRRKLETELEARGLHSKIEEFCSGEEFEDAFRPGQFAVAFLDIYMKEINGIEVAKRLYKQDPNCKIVFLTTSREYLLESYSVRATYYLVKPFSDEKLAQALDFCFPAPDPADMLPVRTKDGTELIQRTEIMYIESISKHGCVFLKARTAFRYLQCPLKMMPNFCFVGADCY